MLSDRNKRDLNEQITREMRTVNGFLTSNVDKAAALDRIIKMKAILDDAPVCKPEEPETDDLTTLVKKVIAELRR